VYEDLIYFFIDVLHSPVLVHLKRDYNATYKRTVSADEHLTSMAVRETVSQRFEPV